MHRHQIAQLACEDGADGLAFDGGKALQRHDFEAGDAHFEVGELQQLREGFGQVRSERLFDGLLGPELQPERNELRPWDARPSLLSTGSSSPESIHPRTSRLLIPRSLAASVMV
ncbi:MAG TPA: hypothetical protein VEK57_17950 [Thermoanaerobaculia bacterium]|nr:hypothetical protein [Thermoanaerobaculia bacterium]